MRTADKPENTIIHQQSAANRAPSTVFKTGNIRTVTEAVAKLVEECNQNGQKFVDLDFNPQDSDHSLLYKEQDIVSEEEAIVINNLKWLRPEEISMKTDIIGFT